MKTSEKVAITKVEIKIAGKSLELTLEQAKELKGILNETFPEPTTYPIVVDRPIYVDRYPNWPYPRWGCLSGYATVSNSSGSTLSNGTLTKTNVESYCDGTLTLEAR